MKCAVVELKYVPKKFFIVRTDWIKNFKGKYSNFEAVLCFISTDLSDEPNFVGKYSETYDGATGVYKVFIRKITETAIAYLKESKRITSVPKKYRVPTNTDSELIKEEKKQKLNEKRMQKLRKENAAIKNASHLADLVKPKHISSEIENTDSDSDSAEKVDTSNNETQNTVQDDSSTSLTAKKSQKSLVNATSKSSQIKYNTTSNTSKVFPEPSSTETKKKENSLSVSTTTTKPMQTNDANKMLSSACNNKGKQPNDLNPTQKGHKQLPARATTSKSIHTKSVKLEAVKEMLPSPPSVINKNQPIVLNTKQKGRSPSIVTTGGEPSRKIILDGAAIKGCSSSSSDNKNPQNQVVDLNVKGRSQSTVTTDGKPPRSIELDGACSSSASVINKNPQNQKKGQNELSAIKVFRTETVTPDAAKKSSTTLSTGKENFKRKTNSPENMAAKKQKVVTAGTSGVEFAGQSTIIKALKEENAHLKIINKTLTEKTEALLKALVVCTKSLPKPLSYEEKDGGRLYSCGVYFDKEQCNLLDSITDDREFCNSLTVAVFGFETLKKSSVTGSVSNRTKGPAKPPLDKNGLKFIYDLMAIRTNNSILYSAYKINKIINKKIANLLAADQPKQPRQPRKSKKAATNNDCEEEDDCKDEIGDREEFGEGDEVSANEDENTQIGENENEEDDYNYDCNDESTDEEQIEKDDEVTTNGNENTQIDENEGEQHKADKPMEEGNEESYENVNGLGDATHENDMATVNITLVNDADETYYVVDIPELQYDFMNDYSLNNL